MDPIFWVRAGSAAMLLAVVLGAFGAHALKGSLSEEMRAVYETGVRYQAYHGLALLLIAALSDRFPGRTLSAAGWCFLSGIILFSGSLLVLSVTGIRKLGAITPIGGALFIVGWGLVLAASVRR